MSPRPGTDAFRVWKALEAAGPAGVHSFDLREVIHTGNPSQRIADIEAELSIDIPRRGERRGRRNGVRYFAPGSAPARVARLDTFSGSGRRDRAPVLELDYRDPSKATERRRPVLIEERDESTFVTEIEARRLFAESGPEKEMAHAA